MVRRDGPVAGWLVAVATALWPVATALAQPASLDDLQKQLDQAKQQKPAQPPKPPRARKSDDPPPAAAAAGPQATLVIEANAECELRVDGTSKGTLRAAQPITIGVAAGQVLIDCTSTQVSGARVRQVLEVKAGAKQVASLDMAQDRDRVKSETAAAQAREDEARKAEERARAEAAALDAQWLQTDADRKGDWTATNDSWHRRTGDTYRHKTEISISEANAAGVGSIHWKVIMFRQKCCGNDKPFEFQNSVDWPRGDVVRGKQPGHYVFVFGEMRLSARYSKFADGRPVLEVWRVPYVDRSVLQAVRR